MAQPVIQTSFSAGEWAPTLNARVDLAKYHSACALALNYFVDYRGGLSSRMGTKWILQAYKSATAVRLVSFQASFLVGYILEFGDFYIRFYNNGSPVLETAKNITGASKADPCTLTIVGHSYSTGDWVYLESIGGMTQLNGRYVKVLSTPTVDTITIGRILDGSNINSTGYTTYTAGGTAKRVYTLPSPYAAADLSLLKFAENVSTMVITHETYVPYVLTLISAANWTLVPITFGSTVSAPTNPAAATTLSAGSVNYAYEVTAVDPRGQESAASAAATLASKQDLRTTAGTNRITWTAVSGAERYNIYKAELSYTNAVPSGAAFGFIGDATGVTFDDSNIAPDFTEAPPVVKNPFQGAGVQSITVTAGGAYTTVPTVAIAAAPAGGATATAVAILQVLTAPTQVAGGFGPAWSVGDIAYFYAPTTSIWLGVAAVVATVAGNDVATFQPMTYPGSIGGSISSGATPANSLAYGNNPNVFAATKGGNADLTWGVGVITLTNPGAGYTAVPAVTFSAGGATATAVLGEASAGNPSVCVYFQQRLILAAPTQAPQTFYMSQPGSYYNYNVSNPTQPDDAITGSIISGQLNTIKSMIPMASGLILLSDKAAWQVYGASQGAPVSATEITAQSQAYNGANDIPPIVANFDILYVQSKGSSVRDLTYNFYTNIFTGTDISVLSSHLFFGHTLTGWAWAEEPFKVVWAIRDDGVMLSLTFLKEQDLIGWTHHTTDGDFKSVATVTEEIDEGAVDAVYLVVERTISGNMVKYIERMADRFITDYTDPWCVDSGLRYDGVPVTTFTGFEHLVGENIAGLADGVPFTATVDASGGFTLATAASFVTAGLPFTADFQTLAIDTGNPTIQGKMKILPEVTVRVAQTLGLQIGTSFSTLVSMKDLQLGQIGGQTNQRVTDLVTGDARTVLDPYYTTTGQFCMRQSLPYPATILGIIPEISVGDTGK